MTTVNLTLDDQDFTPTTWEEVRYRVGLKLGAVAERLRMLGDRVAGNQPLTDEEESRSTYEWGFRMGRESAVMTLVGDTAGLGTLADRRELVR